MLTKVTLTNFQAHKHLEVDCAGFTTLTGGSNGGKSAVLRAIHGLVRNDSAADYVRHGQKTLSVKLDFSDGHSVEWIKGSGENKYVLVDPSGNSRLFDKVGSDVPEEVKQVLRLGPIAIKGSDKEYVNFHNQLEAPFLISATPGSVAKLFGELTSASDLYSAVSEGNRQVRSTAALRTTRKADVDRVKNDLTDYTDLDEQVSFFNLAKLQVQAAVKLNDDLHNIDERVRKLVQVNKSISELTEIISKLLSAENLDLETVYEDAQKYVGIQSVVGKSKKFDEYEVAASNLVRELEKPATLDLVHLEESAAKLHTLKKTLQAIDELDINIQAFYEKINLAQKDISEIEQSIIDATNLLDVCSECGQELSDEAKLKVIEGASEHAAC